MLKKHKELFMQLNRSKLMLACLIASTMAVSACSKNPDSKKDDTLTATAPATGEASNLTERDAKQRLIQTLQAAEAARKQNEERFDGQLSRAERALNANNYGLAKSLAREVLSKAPNNAQARRILRQAEAGESKAFDDMVIE